MLVVADRTRNEHSPEYFRLSDHHASPKLLGVPFRRIVSGVGDKLYFSWFAVIEHTIAL